MKHVQIFLSAVTAEFQSYRKAVHKYLERPNLTVKVQEDFIATGVDLLEKLDGYIQHCQVVIHIVGDMTGAMTPASSVEKIKKCYPDLVTRFPMLMTFLEPGGPALSYTQWEAWLALYHNRILIIAVPNDEAQRDEKYRLEDQQLVIQKAHLERLKKANRYQEIHFTDVNHLTIELLRSSLNDSLPPIQIVSSTLDRFREVASSLLEAGRERWKLPQFVAPLSLETKEQHADSEPQSTNITALTEAVSTGANLLIFGEGGIGKTTFLLELSGTLLAEKCQRIPIYIEATYWARENIDILDYITKSPAALRQNVTTSDLLKLADTGCLTLVVNGWNEIPSTLKQGCLSRFSKVTAGIPALNIVVVSRSAIDAPDLKTAKQIHVRGLTWKTLTMVIRQELDKDLADALIELLVRDTSLRHSARSPLILKGLLAQAKKGEVASASTFDLLGAVVEAYEEDKQRQLALAEPPLYSQHRYILEALACHLTSKQETTSSRRELFHVVAEAASQLFDSKHYGVSPPHPDELLNILSSYHLLHADGQAIRFAHQRFQEYFTATRLLGICAGEVNVIASLLDAINNPIYEDALRLVSGKLKGIDKYDQARTLLISTAFRVDLGFACDLAGTCGFTEVDDSSLYHDLITHINTLCDSSLQEIADYGMCCLIASRFTISGERLWSRIECDDQQIRLTTYRLHGEGISLRQLGEDAEKRIATWPAERQSELMHELGENSENYDYLIRIANETNESTVRVAAITTLGWNFPGSDAALQAWMNASPVVQVEHQVISVIEYVSEQNSITEEMRKKIRELSRMITNADSKLKLALAFPDDAGPSAIDVVLERLREMKYHGDGENLLALANKYAPEKLIDLAREIVGYKDTATVWAYEVIQNAPDEVRAEIFDEAYAILFGEDMRNLSVETVGPLANRKQTLRAVNEWLKCGQGAQSDIERERGRQLGYLLAHAPGDKLFSIVIGLGEAASYEEAAELLDLVWYRMPSDSDRSTNRASWQPTVEGIDSLIEIFWKKIDTAVVPQHKVPISLCRIASHVAPDKFTSLLLDGCRLYLNAWIKYTIANDEWIKKRIGHRPTNPYLGHALASAVEKLGFDAIPSLVELLAHPHADKLIPYTVARIVSTPWVKKEKEIFRNINSDCKNGDERRAIRRVLLQPDDLHQKETDNAAIALSTALIDLINKLRAEQVTAGAEWNEKQAGHQMRIWLEAISNIPSTEIVKPINYALINGVVDIYIAVFVLKGLIRQGVFIEDGAVVSRIESLYEEESRSKWLDDSKRYVLSELIQLMFFVRPLSLLKKSLHYYLDNWQRFSHVNEIINSLKNIKTHDSWRYLVELGNISAATGKPPERLVFALAKNLTHEHYKEFINTITNGALFAWCPNYFNLESIAPSVQRVIGDDTNQLEEFLQACKHSNSILADRFACAVLNLIPNGDSIRIQYGLAALDAGKPDGVYLMLKKMFWRSIPLSPEGHYEVNPKSCNELRRQLYIRAKGAGVVADVSRRLLADVECERREGGRPSDEPRHPVLEDGVSWTDVLEKL